MNYQEKVQNFGTKMGLVGTLVIGFAFDPTLCLCFKITCVWSDAKISHDFVGY